MNEDHIEVFRGQGTKLRERWYWRRVAPNGQVVATGGEGYFSKWNAKRAVRKMFPWLEVRDG